MKTPLNVLIERFFKKVHFIPFHPCWEWVGGTGQSGHGVFHIGNGKMMNAHRFSYTFHKKEPLSEHVVMHSCDNPTCVNPNHLSEGTQKENIHDAMRKGRLRVSKKKYKITATSRSGRWKLTGKCFRGHDITKPENVYTYPAEGKGSVCKLCKRMERLESVRRFRARQKLKQGKEDKNE